MTLPKRTIRRSLLYILVGLVAFTIISVMAVITEVNAASATIVTAILALLNAPLIYYFHARHKDDSGES